MKTKYSIANDKNSAMMNQCRAIAAKMLEFKTWTADQRELLEKMAMRGYVVADIWRILDVFGLRKSYNSHQMQQTGIVIPMPMTFCYRTKNLKKKQLNFALL